MISRLSGLSLPRKIILAILAFAVLSQLVLMLARQMHYRGSTVVTWNAPTAVMADGSHQDLSGYVVHCWSELGDYAKSVVVDDPQATSIEVKNLAPGLYHCAVNVIDAAGEESVLSNIVEKSVAHTR